MFLACRAKLALICIVAYDDFILNSLMTYFHTFMYASYNMNALVTQMAMYRLTSYMSV